MRSGFAATVGILVSAAVASAGVVEREIEFEGTGGMALSGVLVLPEGASEVAPAPGVLLLPGSGPTDRDGNQPPMFMTNLLKQISGALADEGIASFRFDKRAAARYQGAWPGEEELGAFFSYENFVGDAAAAYDVLRSGVEIDASRTGIVGHSEGGMFALQVSSDRAGGPGAPAAVVLLATAGRTLDVVVREQIGTQLDMAGVDDAFRASYMAALDGAIEKVKRGESVDGASLPQGLGGLFNPSAMVLLRAYFTVDPTALASGVEGPVLVLQGDSDMQISSERDAGPLMEALEARDGGTAELVVIEGASHNLKPTSGPRDPGFGGPMDEAAKSAIVEWLGARLGE